MIKNLILFQEFMFNDDPNAQEEDLVEGDQDMDTQN